MLVETLVTCCYVNVQHDALAIETGPHQDAGRAVTGPQQAVADNGTNCSGALVRRSSFV